jgi:hypothetical protein
MTNFINLANNNKASTKLFVQAKVKSLLSRMREAIKTDAAATLYGWPLVFSLEMLLSVSDSDTECLVSLIIDALRLSTHI